MDEPRLLWKCPQCGLVYTKDYVGNQEEFPVPEQEIIAYVLAGFGFKNYWCEVCARNQRISVQRDVDRQVRNFR